MRPPACPLDLLNARGSIGYFGEPVTVLQHSLQTAALARADDAPDALVLAALLHDIGHLLHTAGEDASQHNIDPRHEMIGARLLEPLYGRSVSDPVRMHVAAKRWLCLREPGYREGLAAESERSLVLQGGPFTPEEAAAFEAEPGAQAAVRLRRWDDRAKRVDRVVAPLQTYRELAERLRLA